MRLCEQFASNFEDEGYLLETGLLVRLLVVFATQQSRFKTVGKIKADAFKGAWGGQRWFAVCH